MEDERSVAPKDAAVDGWLYDKTTVTISVQEVSDRLHQDIYGPNSQHTNVHSCPCNLFARWYLGLSEKPKLYWPNGKGGNAWESEV